jgi:hypothetical protein
MAGVIHHSRVELSVQQLPQKLRKGAGRERCWQSQHLADTSCSEPSRLASCATSLKGSHRKWQLDPENLLRRGTSQDKNNAACICHNSNAQSTVFNAQLKEEA